jgi:hypothetical protein
MVAIITNKFRLEQAQIFKDAIDGIAVTPDHYYLFVGRPQPWNTAPVNADLIPDVPSDTLYSERRIWEGMMGLKKILPNNTSFVIPRWNWDASGNTIYVPYSDQDQYLFEHPTTSEIADGNTNGYTPGTFYVMNQYFQVFKCLSNNGGVKSTVEPVADESFPLVLLNLADGYTWKYMFTVQTGDAVKYLTDHWLPVKLLLADDGSKQWLVQSGAADTGVIDSIQVIDPGSLYNRVLNTTTVENLGFVGPNQAVGVPSSSASTNNGWYTGTTLWVVAGTGLGSYSKVVGYLGATKQFLLENTLTLDLTSQFQILPSVEIVGDGANAVAKANVNLVTPNGIESISIINAGTGYNFASATIVGGHSNNDDAILEVVLPPEGGHGANPVTELGGHYIMIDVNLTYGEGSGDFPISNDYRQIGIIKNPEQYNNPNVLFTNLSASASARLTVNNVVGTFPTDSILLEQSPGDAQGFLIEVLDNGLNKDLVYVQLTTTGFENFTIGNNVTAAGASATIQSIVNPEVQKYTGDIIYFENRRPVLRAPDQLENIKIIVEF